GHGDLTTVRVNVGGVAISSLGAGDAGAQFVGLDQINSGALPSSLAGRKEVEVSVTVAGKTTNKVMVVIQ
ncbi:MAG: hypothetical protein HOP19_01935, partial [Acidobacteria bacterium]|nr:hypothetical protein [Acidobacteriota bacterium]